MGKKPYSYKISNLRALAISVVVLGHSIIIYDSSWNYYTALYSSPALETVKHLINLFQMPLFVFISGYCFYYSKNRLKDQGLAAFIKTKAKRLLIPFAAFALLWMIPIRLISRYPFWKGMSAAQIVWQVFSGKDSGHLWFCPALFLIMIIAGAAEKGITQREKRSAFITVFALGALYLLSAASRFLPAGIFFLNDVAKYLVWFWLGYCVNEKQISCSKYAYPGLLLAVLIFVAELSGLLNGVFAIRILLEYAGTTLFVISLFCVMPEKGNRLTEKISKDSFGVYLFHSPMIYIVFCYFSYLKPAAMTAVNFVFLFALACLMTELLRKSSIGRRVIGE